MNVVFSRTDSLLWPMHWQRSAALRWPWSLPQRADLVVAVPSTIAQVLALGAPSPTPLTVTGRVVDFAVDRRYERIRIADGTGELDLHKQRSGTAAMALLSGERLAFDIVVPPGPRPPREPFTVAPEASLEDLLDPVTRGLRQRFHGPADAEIEAIRQAE